jgi:DNA-directed RNA polymerase subunit RPC12/RpoP
MNSTGWRTAHERNWGIAMALIACPDCQSKISDSSNKCIHCGALLKSGHKVISGVGNIFGNSIQFVFGFFIFVGIPIFLLDACFGG